MAIKILFFAVVLAFTDGGLIGSPIATPTSLSYSSLSAPVAYGAPAITGIAAPAPASLPYSTLSAPISYAAPAIAKVAAPVAPIALAAPAIHKVAAPVAYAAPVVKTVVEEYDPHPQYTFAYEINDSVTGDSKGQLETRDGDVVRGGYALVDPDGTRRVVEYSADPVNGFNAVVRKEPLVAKATVAAVAPVAKVHAPLAYAAPRW